MVTAPTLSGRTLLHPLHAVFLHCAAPLYLGGLVSDIAYARTYEIQWLNFSAWLIAGAMVFTGLALLWSLFEIVRGPGRRRPALSIAALLAAMFVLGFLSSLIHARDAWASMPSGLVLSVVLTALAVIAIGLDMAKSRTGAS